MVGGVFRLDVESSGKETQLSYLCSFIQTNPYGRLSGGPLLIAINILIAVNKKPSTS
jgi:hypothetical protein